MYCPKRLTSVLQSLYSLSSPSHLFPPFLGLAIANKKRFLLSIKVWFSFFVDHNCLHCTFMDKNRVLTKPIRKKVSILHQNLLLCILQILTLVYTFLLSTRNPSLFKSYPFFLEEIFDHHRRRNILTEYSRTKFEFLDLP